MISNVRCSTEIDKYKVNYKLTTLDKSIMVWIHASLPSDALSVKLGKDWAVATPSNEYIPCVSTNLLRSSNLNDMAASISRRFATRFKEQVYVSLDLSSSLLPSSQYRNPNADSVMLEIEKRLIQLVKDNR
ncbi:hypothetical protein E3Q00_00251 [Wallemia mellicola]|nr:hypothetical protein E3Q14_02462 [Wallemia mellicola]TIC56295.1 hypothetical protein E3Q05_01821 [Wallemia mellicola]TIC76198.1 hypothetical protein E3Q00_00251 [Wallemia mellicola]